MQQVTMQVEATLKRTELIEKALKGELRWVEVAEILRLTPRQVRRLKKRYQDNGAQGLIDYRRRSRPRNQLNETVVKEVLRLYRDAYRDFNVTHFHEKLRDIHGIKISYGSVKSYLRKAGLITTILKRGPSRMQRERRPMTGMMLQIDGSEYPWLGEDKGNFSLVAVIDDASNEVYSAVFVREENLWSVFYVLRKTVENKGIFCSLYADRASHFFYTPKGSKKVDKSQKTQCQQAMETLGIQMIPAYSPEAKGRIERLWGTLQGRLPQELRLAGIDNLKDANRFLEDGYLAELNKRFSVKPKEQATAFVRTHPELNLDYVFSIKTKRRVNMDNTVSYRTMTLQIPPGNLRTSFARADVFVHEHMNKTISILFGPHLLGRYDASGQLINFDQMTKRKTGT
jgi:transposase